MGRIDHRRIIRIAGKNNWPPPEWAALPGLWHWFGSGREALAALIRAPPFSNPAGKTVLLPAFCPEGVFAPFQREGWRIRFYDLDEGGNPALEQVKGLAAAEKPAIAVLIHLFGIQRDADAFRKAAGAGIFFIEDFAHTWPGEHLALHRNQGGAALFSLPKLAGLPDGGGLLLQGSIVAQGQPGSVKRLVYIGLKNLALLSGMLAWRLDAGWLRFLAAALNGRAYRLLQAYFRRPHRISFTSRFLLRRFDHRALIDAHLHQAALYQAGLKSSGFSSPDLLISPSPTLWPMIGFPLLLDQRDQLVQYLSENKIGALTFTWRWNFVPEAEKANFPGAAALENRHVLLPINAKLSDEHIQHVIQAVNHFAGSVVFTRRATGLGKVDP